MIIRKIFIVAFLIISLVSVCRTIIILWNNNLPDFSVYYYASKLIIQHENPYIDTSLFTQVNYLPSALLLLSPFTIFPYSIAAKIWLALNLGSFILTIIFLYKIKKISLFKISLVVCATVLSFPFKFTLGMGQINILLLLLITICLFYGLKNNIYMVGISLSLAIIAKIFPIVLVFPLIFIKRWSALLWMCSFLGIILLSAILILGQNNNIFFFKEVFPLLIKDNVGGIYYNQSFTGLSDRIGFPLILTLFLRVMFIIISLSYAFRNRKNLFLSFSITLTMVLLINNFTWQHHLVLLILPYFFIISNKASKKDLLFLLISYLLVATNIKNPESISRIFLGNLILSHGFFGMLILWFLLISRLRKMAK